MRRPVPVAIAALLLTAAPAGGGGEPGRAPSSPGPSTPSAVPPGAVPPGAGPEASPRPGASVDAGLLADLDRLDSPDYRRHREAARRQGLLERLRLLEAERSRARTGDPAGAAGSAGKGAAVGGAGETRR